MKMLWLLKFDVISIIPLWIGNNEISIVNLSLTVGFVALIKTDITKLYNNLEVLRNFQVINVLNFSTSKCLLGGIYLSRLIRVQAFQLKKKFKCKCKEAFFGEDSSLGSINDHPFIPSIISVNKNFFLILSNLTTNDYAYFSKNADIVSTLNEVKKLID